MSFELMGCSRSSRVEYRTVERHVAIDATTARTSSRNTKTTPPGGLHSVPVSQLYEPPKPTKKRRAAWLAAITLAETAAMTDHFASPMSRSEGGAVDPRATARIGTPIARGKR